MWDLSDPMDTDPPVVLTRREWERNRRLKVAELFDVIADNAPDLKGEALARWQAALFRWSAEHS